MPPPTSNNKQSAKSNDHEAKSEKDCTYSVPRCEASGDSSVPDNESEEKVQKGGIVKTILGPSLEDTVFRTIEFGKYLIQKKEANVDDKKLKKKRSLRIRKDIKKEKSSCTEKVKGDQESGGDTEANHVQRENICVYGTTLHRQSNPFKPKPVPQKKPGSVSKIRSLDSDLKHDNLSPEKIKRQLEALVQINKDEHPESNFSPKWSDSQNSKTVPRNFTVMPTLLPQNDEYMYPESPSISPRNSENFQRKKKKPSKRCPVNPSPLGHAPEIMSNALGPSLDISIIDNLKLMKNLFRCQQTSSDPRSKTGKSNDSIISEDNTEDLSFGEQPKSRRLHRLQAGDESNLPAFLDRADNLLGTKRREQQRRDQLKREQQKREQQKEELQDIELQERLIQEKEQQEKELQERINNLQNTIRELQEQEKVLLERIEEEERERAEKRAAFQSELEYLEKKLEEEKRLFNEKKAALDEILRDEYELLKEALDERKYSEMSRDLRKDSQRESLRESLRELRKDSQREPHKDSQKELQRGDSRQEKNTYEEPDAEQPSDLQRSSRRERASWVSQDLDKDSYKEVPSGELDTESHIDSRRGSRRDRTLSGELDTESHIDSRRGSRRDRTLSGELDTESHIDSRRGSRRDRTLSGELEAESHIDSRRGSRRDRTLSGELEAESHIDSRRGSRRDRTLSGELEAESRIEARRASRRDRALSGELDVIESRIDSRKGSRRDRALSGDLDVIESRIDSRKGSRRDRALSGELDTESHIDSRRGSRRDRALSGELDTESHIDSRRGSRRDRTLSGELDTESHIDSRRGSRRDRALSGELDTESHIDSRRGSRRDRALSGELDTESHIDSRKGSRRDRALSGDLDIIESRIDSRKGSRRDRALSGELDAESHIDSRKGSRRDRTLSGELDTESRRGSRRERPPWAEQDIHVESHIDARRESRRDRALSAEQDIHIESHIDTRRDSRRAPWAEQDIETYNDIHRDSRRERAPWAEQDIEQRKDSRKYLSRDRVPSVEPPYIELNKESYRDSRRVPWGDPITEPHRDSHRDSRRHRPGVEIHGDSLPWVDTVTEPPHKDIHKDSRRVPWGDPFTEPYRETWRADPYRDVCTCNHKALDWRQKKEALRRNKSVLDAWDIIALKVCHTKLPSFSRAYELERKSLKCENPGSIHCCFASEGDAVSRRNSRSRSRSRSRSSRFSAPDNHEFVKANARSKSTFTVSRRTTEIEGFPRQRDITCGLHQSLKPCTCGAQKKNLKTSSSDDELFKKINVYNPERQNLCRSRSATLMTNKRSKILKVLWAMTRINIFQDNVRTYEVMDASPTPPRSLPCKTEGIFVVKNPKAAPMSINIKRRPR